MNPSYKELDEIIDSFKEEYKSHQKEFNTQVDSSFSKAISKLKDFASKVEQISKPIPKKPKRKNTDESSESEIEDNIPKKRNPTPVLQKKAEPTPHKSVPQKKRKPESSDEETYDSSKLQSLTKTSSRKEPELEKSQIEIEEDTKAKLKNEPKQEAKVKTEEAKVKSEEAKVKQEDEPKSKIKKEAKPEINEKEVIFGSGSESDKSDLFDTEEEEEEEEKREEDTKMDVEEKVPYKSLVFNLENVKRMLADLPTADPSTVQEILDCFENLFSKNFSNFSFSILQESNIPQELRKFSKDYSNEAVKERCQKLIADWKAVSII